MMDWKLTYRALKKRNWFILLLLSGASYFIADRAVTLGVILGGLTIIANFSVLQHTVRRAFSPDGVMEAGKWSILLKTYARLFVLGIIIFVLVTQGLADPIGLGIGLSTVVFSIVSYGIQKAVNTSYSREAV
jgi:hypothetical protein